MAGDMDMLARNCADKRLTYEIGALELKLQVCHTQNLSKVIPNSICFI